SALTDKDIVRCSENDSAKVVMDAFPNAVFYGTISKLGTFPDPVTGTYEVEILLDDQNAEFRTGFISQVTITPSDTVNAFILPLKAIIDIEGDYGYVFQIDSSKVKKQKVRLGGLQNDGIVIFEGINENQQVVIDGAGFLKNGDRIRVVN
ncbi:MAG TPA: hypothetical protein VJ951_15155, partial [Bacteroidales bacterium]|nr:hypothetical protein [Bacteroidales bacterium]